MTASPRLADALLLALTLLLAATLAAGRADAAPRTFEVAAAGDISCPQELTNAHLDEFDDPGRQSSEMRCQGRRVADLILSSQPGIVLTLGDLIQNQPSTTRAYDDFERTWGHLDQRIMPTIGNHDYTRQPDGSVKPSGYFDFWERQGAPWWRIGARNRGWSSWNAGNWHFINLNSNCNRVDCTLSGPQMRWLLEDLKANRKANGPKCLMAYFHHPRFSAGIPAGRTADSWLLVNAWELLYRFRADVVVTGHQHFYQRFRKLDPQGNPDPTGIAQFITGTGGASTFPITADGDSPAANSDAAERRLGATFFELGPDSYGWEFRSIRGKVFDRSSQNVRCHGAGAGTDRRLPRLDRYVAHMKKVTRLAREAKQARAKLKKAKRRGDRHGEIRRLEKRVAKTTSAHRTFRKRPLYPASARPGT